MKGKIVQKIISGGLLVSLLFTNITNVLAATIVRPSNFIENKLSLHDFSIITGATNYDKGYAGIKTQVSNDKKTINNIIESTYYLSESGILLLPILEKMISWGNINLSCEE